MVTYKLIVNEGNIISYKYFPEGDIYSGTISLNKNTKELIDLELASSDIGDRYAVHVIEKIEDFIDKDDYKEKGMIAWY